MHKILVVDDEADLTKGLELNLKSAGYEVYKAFNGEQGLRIALREKPDLIILDVMMPGMSGLDVCREIRNKGLPAQIIMLTARADEVDRVVGLELGADDYLSKPFSMRELEARIRARLRDHRPAPSEDLTQFRFEDVEVDFENFLVKKRGKALSLTSKELEVLRFLVLHRGEVVTRDRLLDEVWGYNNYPTTRTVDTHILRLRKKLEVDPANPRHILSVYGGGYKFVG